MSAEAEPAWAAIIVAHPDDEILWAGGLILSHPEYQWFIACLCRKSDPDRAPKFGRILNELGARGEMSDLDDGPEQSPMEIGSIQHQIQVMLPRRSYELLLTHSPFGEYTRHRRHEEVSRAVIDLWMRGQLVTRQLGLFAYHDHHGSQFPEAILTADLVQKLPAGIFEQKRKLIVDIYGFAPESWEVRTTPQKEAFWLFDSPPKLEAWMREKEAA